MESLRELFEDGLKDIYSAEKQLIKALPKLQKLASNEQLKSSIETHLEETKQQATRIEECAKALGIKPSGMVCKGMQGLIEETNEHLGQGKPGPVMDAEIVLCAQKAEHYEICAYGTMLEWAKQLGIYEQCTGLKQNMSEEDKTDKILTNLAESEINRMAAQVVAPEPKKSGKTDGKASSSVRKTVAARSAAKQSSTKQKVSVR